MLLKLFFIIFLQITLILCEYKITPAIRAKCKEFYCKKGYVYDVFYTVNEGHRPKDMAFELHLAIKAPNNGHILMSSTRNPKMTDPVYEITVGAGGNTFSELRRMRMKMGKSTVDTPDILSWKVYAPFWIKAYRDGYIKFGREGEELAILSYFDPAPLQINYFSFAAWNGIEARFLYDCPVNNTQVNESIAVPEPPKTDSARLRNDLLKEYNPYQIPLEKYEDEKQVIFTYNIHSVKYDVKKFHLETHGRIALQWSDNKLMWDPSNYGNISAFNFRHREIWVPDLIVYNSIEVTNLEDDSLQLRVNRQGIVMKQIYFKVKTICVPKNDSLLARWPRDEHTCDLVIGGRQVALYDMKDRELLQFPLDERDYVSTEWQMVNNTIRQDNIGWGKNLRYFNYDGENYEVNAQTSAMIIQLKIKRIYKTYALIYFTPLFCSILIMLLSFWMTSSPATKISLLCFDVVLILICLSQVVKQIPLSAYNTPNIVWFYYSVLIGVCVCICTNVFVIYLRTEPKPWPHMNETLKRFLIASPITTALGLPDVKMKETYMAMDDAQSTSEDDEQLWDMLSLAIDRLMLIIFTIASAIVLSWHY